MHRIVTKHIEQDQWICVQSGAREHYAVPRMLRLTGQLRGLITDIWCPGWLARLACQAPFRRLQDLAGRYHRDLADSAVIDMNVRFMFHGASRSIAEVTSHRRPMSTRLFKQDRWFTVRAKNLVERLCRSEPLSLFSYCGTACELFEWAKPLGIRCVLGQTNPGFQESDPEDDEMQRWPGWEFKQNPTMPAGFWERRKREWELADRLLVNSEWSRQCLTKGGAPAEKIRIVPLSYDVAPVDEKPAVPREGPLRVLWIGQVRLRKGIQYLMEAARLLLHEPIVFDIYGPIQITDHALSQMPKNMQFFGSVSRLKVAELYQEYDVFVLPTLSDGFAITQLEAMAYGLPVIATPNCGRVVTDGCDGFVVPPRDAETLATRIFALSRDPALRTHMSDTARWTIRRFSLKSVASILSNALSGWECGP